MKPKGINKRITSMSIMGALLGLAHQVQAGTMGPLELAPSGKVYVGVFGGGGASTTTNISQYGTAFFTEALGGPLAVNAFGSSSSRSVGLVGGHLGYQWSPLSLSSLSSPLAMSPAVELEGYYLGKSTFTGHEINSDTVRLPEHDFLVTYPMDAGVFLGNALLNFNHPNLSRWHPYVGAGIGAAVLSISNAQSIQVSPAEPGVNHYNSKTSDSVSAFAAQAKAGLDFDLNEHTTLLLEYRGLYMANTRYTFGSTVYPAHAATSSWLVGLASQYYNLGAIGIQYSI